MSIETFKGTLLLSLQSLNLETVFGEQESRLVVVQGLGRPRPEQDGQGHPRLTVWLNMESFYSEVCRSYLGHLGLPLALSRVAVEFHLAQALSAVSGKFK